MGPLSRRTILTGLGLYASPSLARGENEASSSASFAPSVESVSMVMPGNVTYLGRLFKPRNEPAHGIILVPDGWGLTKGFEAMGLALASVGILGLVVDMLGGKTASNPQEAERLAAAVNAADASEAISAWFDWLRARSESNQRVGAFGFGVSGGWALGGSLRQAISGVAVWSTRVNIPSEDLTSIYPPTLIGHYSEFGNPSGAVIVSDLEARMRAAKRTGYFFQYRARPFFYNPESPDYDKLNAALAWHHTINIYRNIWTLPPPG